MVLNQLVLKMENSCYLKVAFKHRLKMIWRILRDRQVVVITESYGRLYSNWDARSLEDVCQMCHKVHDMAYMMNNKK